MNLPYRPAEARHPARRRGGLARIGGDRLRRGISPGPQSPCGPSLALRRAASAIGRCSSLTIASMKPLAASETARRRVIPDESSLKSIFDHGRANRDGLIWRILVHGLLAKFCVNAYWLDGGRCLLCGQVFSYEDRAWVSHATHLGGLTVKVASIVIAGLVSPHLRQPITSFKIAKRTNARSQRVSHPRKARPRSWSAMQATRPRRKPLTQWAASPNARYRRDV
jgi:hypothetical protein